MGTGGWMGLGWLTRGPWSRRTDDAARRVEEAAAAVGRSNAEVTRATFDHADSVRDVRTTIEATLDTLERRSLKDNA